MGATEGRKPQSANPSVEPWLQNLSSQLDRLLRTSAEIPSSAPAGTVGRFKLERLIGHGAFGVVYAAIDPQLGRKVALKLPRVEVLLDSDKLQRFIAEANLAAKLDHPGIVPVYEAQLDGPTPYIASMLVEGLDLAEWLEQQQVLAPWQQSAAFLAEVAAAVHFAHEQGVFHRDLKPSNILLQAPTETSWTELKLIDAQARITDFGLAKAAASNLIDTKSSQLIGTLLYMAPEQFEEEEVRNLRAVDIYSLGVILFELLTGEPPRADASYASLLDRVRNEAPPKLARSRKGLPGSLERICQKCLERNPRARYESAEALAMDLRRVVAGEDVHIPWANWTERLGYWLTRTKRIVDAGSFTIWCHVVMMLWTISVTFAAPLVDTGVPRNFVASCVQLGVVIVTLHLPMIWLGRNTVRQKPWSIPVGVVVTGLVGIPAYIPLFGDALFWPELYNKANPFFKFMVHAMLSLCFLISFLLYVIAWFASRSHSNRAPSAN